MKRSMFLFVLLGTASVYGQQSLPERDQPRVDPDTNKYNYRDLLLKVYPNRPGQLPLATYSHTTSRGKIYTLPVDNMPCLVPDLKQVKRMPEKGIPLLPEKRMPNGVPRQKIIPQ
jgi:hypothetical protein